MCRSSLPAALGKKSHFTEAWVAAAPGREPDRRAAESTANPFGASHLLVVSFAPACDTSQLIYAVVVFSEGHICLFPPSIRGLYVAFPSVPIRVGGFIIFPSIHSLYLSFSLFLNFHRRWFATSSLSCRVVLFVSI